MKNNVLRHLYKNKSVSNMPQEGMRTAAVFNLFSSLNGSYGIGDLHSAKCFVSDLEDCGISWWSMCPMNPTSYGDSPYMCHSAFAGSHYYISLDELKKEGLLTDMECVRSYVPRCVTRVNYGELYKERTGVLHLAFQRFIEQHGPDKSDYKKFVQANHDWLKDFALFMAIKEDQRGKPWQEWPEEFRLRDEKFLKWFKKEYDWQIKFWYFVQFIFFKQWNEFREFANKMGVRILGDVPFYVAGDSADAWAHLELFTIDAITGYPVLYGGVPGDQYDANDRNWGVPCYNWKNHEKNGFKWWRRKIEIACQMYDGIRIDHVIGMAKYYGIPANEGESKWYDGPDLQKPRLMKRIQSEARRYNTFVVTEDLGSVPPGLRDNIAALGWSGMRVLQFAFSGKYGANCDHLPFYHRPSTVIYTGTHDCPTLKEFLDGKSEEELSYMKWWTGTKSKSELHWALIKEAYKSSAGMTIIPLADFFELDAEARPVNPADPNGAWSWRMTDIYFSKEMKQKLRDLAVLTGRVMEYTPGFQAALSRRMEVKS